MTKNYACKIISLVPMVLVTLVLVACGPAETNTATPAVASDNQSAPKVATVSTTVAAVSGEKPPNFLVMIGDDMSVETLSCYKIGSNPAQTPTLDNLCNSGIRFDNFWAQPVCSPTRATVLSGQYGFRNGVGAPATSPRLEYPTPEKLASAPEEAGGRTFGGGGGGGNAMGMGGGMAAGMAGGGMAMDGANAAAAPAANTGNPGLYPEAYGLPAALLADVSKNYQTAAVGKWHLADEVNGALDHPQRVGFEHYSGNINTGGVPSFYAWPKLVDGEHTSGETNYVTSVTVDDGLKWLDNKRDDAPWLLWVAFNAPHSPWGAPPDELLSKATAENLKTADLEGDLHAYYAAMIEAMDTEIARLLAGIDPDELDNTYIIFMGDNGTPNQAVTAPVQRQKAKGGLYQGGVNVPFMVKGPGINAAVTKSLTSSVDLYATILDLADIAADDRLATVVLDSVSIAPVLNDPQQQVRDFAYADVFGSVGGTYKNHRTIRNLRYKLISDVDDSSEELYDLQNDPWEDKNLLESSLASDAESNYQDLKQRLASLVSDKSRFK